MYRARQTICNVRFLTGAALILRFVRFLTGAALILRAARFLTGAVLKLTDCSR